MKRGISIIYILLFFIIYLGVPCEVYAETVEQKSFLEQLNEAYTKGNVYEIKQDGSGDFTTIQEGVDAADSEDTLLIYPGVYHEAVEIYDKTVHLLGMDRDNCILQYESMNYDKVPLAFGAGRIANMTICGYQLDTELNIDAAYVAEESLFDAAVESIESWQKKFSGYALHIDQDYTYGKEVYIRNCKIISNANQCVGVGCRGKSSITFDECELISKGSGGCIYFHNMNIEDMGGESHFIMKNCELMNYVSPYVISMHSTGAINPVYLTFQNVKTSTIAYDEMTSYNVTNMNTSYNIDEMMLFYNIDILSQMGYYSSINEKFVTILDRKESAQYVSSLIKEDAKLIDNVALSEGITYLSTKKMDEKAAPEEAVVEIQTKQRHIIDIYNFSRLVGDGWCGLDHIYLTPDSYGNTLIEMNYPIVQ